MVTSWFQSRFSLEGRFLRHLQEGRWNKLVPRGQLDALARFVSRSCMTPGREQIVLRFAAGKEKTVYLWVAYDIVSFDQEKAELALNALFVPMEDHELDVPEGYEDEPFFEVDHRRGRARADDQQAS